VLVNLAYYYNSQINVFDSNMT